MHKFAPKRIVCGLRWRFLYVKHRLLSIFLSLVAEIEVWIRFHRHRKSTSHRLPGELIISLTSHQARFPTLLSTLKCLLSQSIKADRIILWVDKDAGPLLPAPIIALQSKGLEIRTCSDIGPYTKIIPALIAFPNAFIVTADDDLYYYTNWLRDLISNWDGSKNQIVCHRAHKIKFEAEHVPMPYNQWNFDIAGPVQSIDIFPTGVGGVLYPPGCFAAEVLDEDLFLTLAPRADDIWLYWMGRRGGAIYRKTPGRMKHILWLRSQKTALARENLAASANDAKIAAMIQNYGWPG